MINFSLLVNSLNYRHTKVRLETSNLKYFRTINVSYWTYQLIYHQNLFIQLQDINSNYFIINLINLLL